MKNARLVASLWALASCATTSGSKDPVNCYRPCSESAEGVEAYRECVDACLEGKPRRPQVKARIQAGAKGGVTAGAKAAPPTPEPPRTTPSPKPPSPPGDEVEFLLRTEKESDVAWVDFRVARDTLFRIFTGPHGYLTTRMERMLFGGGSTNDLREARSFANGDKPSPQGTWRIPEEEDAAALQAICAHPAAKEIVDCDDCFWAGDQTFYRPGRDIEPMSKSIRPRDRNPVREWPVSGGCGVAFKWDSGKQRGRGR